MKKPGDVAGLNKFLQLHCNVRVKSLAEGCG
jgi:hypothetical protein